MYILVDKEVKYMNEELKKQKTVLVLEILGLFFSVLFFVLFYMQKDNSFWTFLVIVILDLIEIPRTFKKYKELKEKS